LGRVPTFPRNRGTTVYILTYVIQRGKTCGEAWRKYHGISFHSAAWLSSITLGIIRQGR